MTKFNITKSIYTKKHFIYTQTFVSELLEIVLTKPKIDLVVLTNLADIEPLTTPSIVGQCKNIVAIPKSEHE